MNDWVVVGKRDDNRCTFKKQDGRVFARLWEHDDDHSSWVIYIGSGNNVAEKGQAANLEQAKSDADVALRKIAGFNK